MSVIKNIVTIDPSLTCTAVTCNGNVSVFAKNELIYTKSGKQNKWFTLSEEHGVEIVPTDLSYKSIKNYSKLEIEKLRAYKSIVKNVLEAIDKNSNMGYTLFIIEGYSYSSGVGPIIDLVTFGTLLRNTLNDIGSIVILSPSTIKKEAAKLTYQPIKKGKKLEYRNKDGVSGGSFSKTDILKCLVECDTISHDWIDFLKIRLDELTSLRTIHKPIEDINDSLICYFIVEKICKEENFRLAEVLNRLEQLRLEQNN